MKVEVKVFLRGAQPRIGCFPPLKFNPRTSVRSCHNGDVDVEFVLKIPASFCRFEPWRRLVLMMKAEIPDCVDAQVLRECAERSSGLSSAVHTVIKRVSRSKHGDDASSLTATEGVEYLQNVTQ